MPHGRWRRLHSTGAMCHHTQARHSDSGRQGKNHSHVRAHMSLRAQHWTMTHWKKQQICTLHNRHQWIQVQGGCFWSVIKRLPHITKPHHTGNTAQIYQPTHQASNFQEEHFCTFTHCLLPHLQLQVRAYFCGTTIPPPTNQDLIHIVSAVFCSHVGAAALSRASAHPSVLTLYLVAHAIWHPCLFKLK